MDKENLSPAEAPTVEPAPADKLTKAIIGAIEATPTETPVSAPEPTDSELGQPSHPASGNSPADPQPAADPQPDLATLLAEAEQKGYLRGRNERIEELMSEPRMFQPLTKPNETEPRPSEPFLSNLRPSIWDA